MGAIPACCVLVRFSILHRMPKPLYAVVSCPLVLLPLFSQDLVCLVYAVAAAIDRHLSSALQQKVEDAHFPQNGCLDRLVAVLWIGRIVLYLLHQMEAGPFRNSS